MTHARSAVVIGGGIAGPVMAMALQKAGIEAIVYEARPARTEGTGAFLTLASNGIDALRVLDAAEPVLAVGFATPTITLRSATGKRLGEAPLGRPPADGTTSHTLRRADLHRVLHEQALARGVGVEHGKRLVDARPADTGVLAVFADGSHAVADVLIGADGVHSTVRALVDPAARAPRYAGLVGTGGYARGAGVEIQPGSFEMIFGKRAFFGYTLAPDGEVWWFANLPRRDEPTRSELEAIGGDDGRTRLLELYADDAGPALELIEGTPQIAPVSPMHTVAHLPRWHTERRILIGDAVHAPTPSSGQGASLAIEDAVMLAGCLRDHDPQTAFANFEKARRPRVEGIVKRAARTNAGKAAGPVGRVVRDAMLPAILRTTAVAKAHRQTYDYRIDWDSRTGSEAPTGAARAPGMRRWSRRRRQRYAASRSASSPD